VIVTVIPRSTRTSIPEKLSVLMRTLERTFQFRQVPPRTSAPNRGQASRKPRRDFKEIATLRDRPKYPIHHCDQEHGFIGFVFSFGACEIPVPHLKAAVAT